MTGLPRYTAQPDGRLSAAMRADYADAGVLVLEGFVDKAECQALRDHVLEMVAEFEPEAVRHVFSATDGTQLGDAYFEESGDKIRFVFEGSAFDQHGSLVQDKHLSLNKMGHAMHDLDPVFDRFSRTPELAQVAEDIGFDDPLILQSMVVFKPPRIGGEVQCHQDSTYIYTDPESCVGFWFALEDATIDNGCMQFIPGGHKMGLKKRHLRGADGKLTDVTLDDAPWPAGAEIPAEAEAGTLVIFDGRAPHLSGPNRSGKSRQAYTLHVIERECHYPAENWLQRGPELPLRGFVA
jgi:phytanoyl-CoA hydroxylase